LIEKIEKLCNINDFSISYHIIKNDIGNLKNILNFLDNVKNINEPISLISDKGKQYLKIVYNVYKILYNIYDTIEIALDDIDTDMLIKYSKELKVISTIKSYINKLDIFNNIGKKVILSDINSHIIEVNDNVISLIPIFINSYFSNISDSKYNLFMSATINDYFIKKTLYIDENRTSFIGAKNPFSKESKMVMFLNYDNLNYHKLKNESTYNDIGKMINNILKHHENQNGLILTTTFEMGEQLMKFIDTKHSCIMHNSGENLNDIVENFKKDSLTKKILVSPSIFEGVDMRDKTSEFEIFIKAPYQSIASKRWKHILEHYQDIYQLYTLFKIVQGFGRSTRSINDKSIIYAIDSNIGRLFLSSENIWKNQFEIV
jgi:ATP-dependent DNA helicase DinG